MTVRHDSSYESSMMLLPTPQVWGAFLLVRVAAGISTEREWLAKNYSPRVMAVCSRQPAISNFCPATI